MKKILIFGIIGLIGYGLYKANQPTAKPKTIHFGDDVAKPTANTAAARMIGANTANPNAK